MWFLCAIASVQVSMDSLRLSTSVNHEVFISMKLSIPKSTFLKALAHGQSVVAKRTTIPILSHVLLEAEDDNLHLSTTDMDIALIESVPARVLEKGRTCVAASMLYEIVRKLSEVEDVILELNALEQKLTICSRKSRFVLPVLAPDDFPQLTRTPLTHHFSLAGQALQKLVDTTRFSMSSEESRYSLNGLFFHATAGDSTESIPLLRAVATDMHRLACCDVSAPEGTDGMPEIIVSRKTIQEVRKLLDEASDQPVKIGVSVARIEFTFERPQSRAVLTSRLVDGKYPDYKAALSVGHEKIVRFAPKVFAEAVDRVGTVVFDRVRAVRFTFTRDKALISAMSQEFGSAEEDIDIQFPYDDSIEICFNVRYVLDVLQHIQDDEVEMFIENGDASVLIKPVAHNQKHYASESQFLLMPMRI